MHIRILYLPIIALALILSISYGTLRDISAAPKRAGAVSGAPASAARLRIDYRNGTMTNVSDAPVVDGETMRSFLERTRAARGISSEIENYGDLGVFVIEMGGRRNGAGGRTWQYWVNSRRMGVSIDRYRVQPGDTIEWKFAVFNQK